jgi:hypothetical protein
VIHVYAVSGSNISSTSVSSQMVCRCIHWCWYQYMCIHYWIKIVQASGSGIYSTVVCTGIIEMLRTDTDHIGVEWSGVEWMGVLY